MARLPLRGLLTPLLVSSLLLLVLSFSGPASSASPQTPTQVPCDWTGVWNTDYGLMFLRQNGNVVAGTYLWTGYIDRVQGTTQGIDNTVFAGTWSEPPDKTGDFEFTMTNLLCNAFTGVWGHAGEPMDGTWNGTRFSLVYSTFLPFVEKP